jgi:hypothetical protein
MPIGSWDENDRRRTGMFEPTERITFRTQIAEVDKDWWVSEFYDRHGLTPENIGDRLSDAWPGKKSMTVSELDGLKKSFEIRFQGSFGDGTFWAHDRILDITGGVLRAEGMTIPLPQQKQGLGRAFMQNAADLCLSIGIDKIHLAADDIGRYAWIRCGFLPEQGSWDTLRRSMMPKLIELKEDLPAERFSEIMDMLLDRRPTTARLIAGLRDPVRSQVPTEQGDMFVAVGRVLFLDGGATWQGDLNLTDKESMLLLRGK